MVPRLQVWINKKAAGDVARGFRLIVSSISDQANTVLVVHQNQ
jgi:hypothetical protein